MSGPIQQPDAECRDEAIARIEAREGRTTDVGGLPVTRVLPTKGRRTVGAWCFVDLLGPMDAEHPDPMEIGPHPHIGLSTVTWLLDGEALHTDSLGTEQPIRPGQLNLMTAGNGIAHAEYAAKPPFRGVQLWLAQPEHARHGPSSFQHHTALPVIEHDVATSTLFAGTLDTETAPTRTDTDVVAADVTLRGKRAVLPVNNHHELAVVPLESRVKVGDAIVEPGWIGLIPVGADELPIETEQGNARLLLLGGVPLWEPIVMWWNFVARNRDEITAAYHDWAEHSERFNAVPTRIPRIDAPVPPWLLGGQ